MELEAAQDAPGVGGRKCLIQRAGGMDRQIVLHDTDAGGMGIMDIDELAHAVRVVYGGAAVRPVWNPASPDQNRGISALVLLSVCSFTLLFRLGRCPHSFQWRPLPIIRWRYPLDCRAATYLAWRIANSSASRSTISVWAALYQHNELRMVTRPE